MCQQLLSHCHNAVCQRFAKYKARVGERTRWARGVTQKNNIKDGVEPAMNEDEKNGIMFHNNFMSGNTPWDQGMQLPSNNDADVCANENCVVANNTGTQENMDEDDDDTDDSDVDEKTRLIGKTE